MITLLSYLNFKAVPKWVWYLIGFFIVAVAFGKFVGHYMDLKASVQLLTNDNQLLTETNSNLASDNRQLIADQKQRAAANDNINKQTNESNGKFDSLDDELKAAILQRDALEAAAAAQAALNDKNPNKDINLNKPIIVVPATPAEIDILWKAFCLESTSAKCTKVK